MLVGVRTNRPEELARLKEHLPPGWKPSTSERVEYLYSAYFGGEGGRPGLRRFHLLYEDIARLARTTDAEELFERFEGDVQLLVAQMARRRVFVHAGVVGWKGRAVLLPGPSLTGKTTLVAELVRAGAVYYSDEYAVLDAKGMVHPYPRALSVRRAGRRVQTKVSVEELGGRPCDARPLPVGLVVLSRYREGARWRPRELTRGRGSLALLANTVPARARPEAVLDALGRAVAGARVLSGARGEAAETARRILERLA